MQKLIWSKGEYTKTGWINAGWKKVPIEKEDQKFHKAKPTIINDIVYSFPRTEMDMFQNIQNEIQFGLADVAKDNLSIPMRQLFESTDDWHITKANKLFKIVDPITQAKDGEWGNEASDADIDILEDQPTVARIYLEQSGIISSLASNRQITDLCGSICAEETIDKEIQELGLGSRVDCDTSRLSVMPGEITFGDEEVNEDFELFEEAAEEEVVSFKDPRMINTALPSLPESVLKRIEDLKKELDEILLKAKDEDEKEQLFVIFEHAIDKEINAYLTLPLNSPLCGKGYSPPRRKHEYIDIANISEVSEAATERQKFFYDLFNEAADCSNYYDLFGNRISTHGFYGKIRGMNAHDKELSNEWSIEDREDKDGNIIISALNQARQEYIKEWRTKEKGDEESLRIALWVLYDRTAGDSPAIYENGKLITPRKRYKDSFWRQRRTEALQDLFLTKSQWNAIYKILGIIKNRITLNKGSSDFRMKILAKMKEYFVKVQNLSDLTSYVKWAEQRSFIEKQPTIKKVVIENGQNITKEVASGLKYKTYDFKPSLIDSISINDEIIWRKAVANKRKFLLQQLFIFNQMAKNIQSIEETDLPEISVACHDHRCDCMVTGKPQFAKIDGNKGHLFIFCGENKTKYNKTLGCSKPIWLIDYKESCIPVTKEEAILKFKEKYNA